MAELEIEKRKKEERLSIFAHDSLRVCAACAVALPLQCVNLGGIEQVLRSALESDIIYDICIYVHV